MSRVFPFSVTTIIVVCMWVFSACADDDSESAASALRPMNDIEWSQMTVRILDPDGGPLKGATVIPWALRAGNGHGAWQTEAYGAPRRTSTDVNGETEVVFPRSVKWQVVNPVVQVSIFIAHPEFCTRSVHVDVSNGDPSEFRLENGFRLRIAGVQPGSDQPLSHCHVLLENGDSSEPEFVQEPDGWLKSVPVRADRNWFRVVRTVPGELPQFSKPHAWRAEDPASREVRVEVRPGVRVLGRLSPDVQRPIERGHVAVRCGSPVHLPEGGRLQRPKPIWWAETVPINRDGTFEFPSLPSGFLVQFWAIANDSISAQPSDEEYETCCQWFGEKNRPRHPVFRYGQILRLAGAESQMTLEMEPAGSVLVKCKDPEGRPLAGIHVSSWPNQYTVGGGSWLFCSPFSSLEVLRSGRHDRARENPFTATTDSNGEGLIRNLPTGQQSLAARNDRWTGRLDRQAETEAGETVEIEMTLQRVP